MAAETSPVEAKLRAYVNELVHQPLKRAGYRRNGRVWRSEADGVVRVVDLQRERKGSSINFTLNVGVAVPGYNWYLFGFDDGQPDASLGVVSGRIGYALDPPRDVWFVVGGEEGLRRIDWSGMDAASDGVELLQALTERVVPALAAFSTRDDVLTYLGRPEHRIPFLGRPVGRDPDEGLRAVIAWRASGSPVPSVTVAPLGDSGVRVEAPPELVEQRPDLVETMVEAATPVDDAIRIRNVVSPRPGIFEIQGRRLRPDRMKASYERFLAVRRFGATPPRRPSPMWLYSDDDAELDDVSIETAEGGDDVLVTFSDEVAHEHVDLVEQCLDRCRAFPGVEDAHWQDRELIVLRGAQIDRLRLQNELLSFVRGALASRSLADDVDDG